jgi:hypothetical protein
MKYAARLLAFLILATVVSGPASAKDCRLPHLPDKGALKPPPGCDGSGKPNDAARLKQQNGFVDLGNGTNVRISGRVRVDAGVRR